ncbi:HD domain-containing phosphohydrolase [Microlunatus ginsengisoli]|uniref:HD domain-containing protein n=1 Tax=Microlunatus ginsengisoli TaxID=363863 RepID=A0ABP7AQ96_9ACTN
MDLGFDQPMEHVLRQTVIAMRLAERLGADDLRSTLYYTSLLVDVGCHADAHEQAKWFGDDIALRAGKYRHDLRGLRGLASGVAMLGSSQPPLHRVRVGLAFATVGHRELDRMIEGHARLARSLAERLGLDPDTCDAVSASYERWDGRGWPGRLRGEQIPLASRLAQLAEHVEVAHRLGGTRAALALARSRAGTQFDPSLVASLAAHAEVIFAGVDRARSWDRVIESEPELRRRLVGPEVDLALGAVADFVDLKSPYTLGHSRQVAELAGATGRVLGLPDQEVVTLRRAGLVHDFGRLGVSNGIWDKPGPVGTGEWERIRLYPYFTERMLVQSATLAPLAALAVQHRERLDGSGYPRGTGAVSLTVASRVLAVADSYRTFREPRPHRPALGPEAATTRLRAEARAGRLDADVVEALLSAAGQTTVRRHSAPAGLSPREVQVLQLIARGLSSREIAGRLTISPKTVRNHTEHIYAKTGIVNRVTASLYATEHGLTSADLDEEPA